MYPELLKIHSILRYIVLILLIAATVKSFIGWINKKEYTGMDNKLSLFAMISVHTQLVIGLVLYFISPYVKAGLSDMKSAMKMPDLRFWTVEHISMMFAAIIFITLGRIWMKKAMTGTAKHKRTAVLFGIGLVIILLAIPWPFSGISRPWI